MRVFLPPTRGVNEEKKKLENWKGPKLRWQKATQNKFISYEKPAKIFALFDEYFDYVTIAKISLGKHLKSLNDNQKSQFFSAFEKRLKSSFIDKLALYTNQDMKVLGTNKPKSNRLNLETQIIGEDKNYSVVFKFFPDKSDNWRVYDVDILGVSIVQTYRSQFGDGALSFNEILDRLNNANLPEDK